jgi:hypothetical protein
MMTIATGNIITQRTGKSIHRLNRGPGMLGSELLMVYSIIRSQRSGLCAAFIGFSTFMA